MRVPTKITALCLLLAVGLAPQSVDGQGDHDVDTSVGDQWVTEYFRLQSERLSERTFADIDTLEDWENRRESYRGQLLEMLGLDPFPDRTPLSPKVTGRTEAEGIIVENLQFQSRPGLYVTANLYRPAEQSEPLPAVLYVCGHGGVKKDGISYGNKVTYQHHGAWLARHGYVCLTIDTIQLGEIEGIHHGTYREKMWWWNNRGYSPAGVEAWNCIRSLDYLQSRAEVDGDRIGVTGRSGGGAYSWWIAALDERITAAVPVAGITSLHNHVVDGCVEGHCDCMYMVNTYRWDYPMVAALVAPRPLLISNTDKDRIFPLDGVVDVHSKVRKIYRLYGAEDKLGLHITEGPHKDTQELRIHAFRWLNRFLKNDDSLIEQAAVKFFEPQQLKVFDQLPADQIVTRVHESFVPAVSRDTLPGSPNEFLQARENWMTGLTEKTFRGWPAANDSVDLDVQTAAEVECDGIRVSKIQFHSQPPYRLAMYVVARTQAGSDANRAIAVSVLDQAGWSTLAPVLSAIGLDDASVKSESSLTEDGAWKELAEKLSASPEQVLVYCQPRGVGMAEWSRDERKRTHIRRRFMQLGQTAATMQIWDVRRALQAIDQIPAFASSEREIRAEGDAAVWSLYASLWEPRVTGLRLEDLPTTNRQAPDLLNVSRIVELTHVLLMAADRAEGIELIGKSSDREAWQALQECGLAAAQKIRFTPTSSTE
jgi:dienelactone hydrolase